VLGIQTAAAISRCRRAILSHLRCAYGVAVGVAVGVGVGVGVGVVGLTDGLGDGDGVWCGLCFPLSQPKWLPGGVPP
jgi:hypothetical protein